MRHRHASARRDSGLRRLSRLTWRATLLSAVTAVGMATLFARTGQSASRLCRRHRRAVGSAGRSQHSQPGRQPGAHGSSRSPAPPGPHERGALCSGGGHLAAGARGDVGGAEALDHASGQVPGAVRQPGAGADENQRLYAIRRLRQCRPLPRSGPRPI